MKCSSEIRSDIRSEMPSEGCSKNRLLQELNEVSFAVNDMALFLDTHPQDERALDYFREMVSRRQNLLKEYAQNYGPLVMDCTEVSQGNSWSWAEQPFPWEQKGGCR